MRKILKMLKQHNDSRVIIEKMEAEEQAARENLERLTRENAKKKKELLETLRAEDLADVRAKCVLHGFTATDLKGALKMRGRGRPTAAAKPKRDPNAPKRKYTRKAKPAV
jgi:uncharacterized Rmd1/YagE family protein